MRFNVCNPVYRRLTFVPRWSCLQIHINTIPFLGTVAFTSLPSALNQSFPEPDPPSLTPPRVLFQFFGSERLFMEPEVRLFLLHFKYETSLKWAFFSSVLYLAWAG